MVVLAILLAVWHDEETTSDEALMQRFIAGDPRALGVLYDRHARALKAFAQQQGARRPDEVVQDTFLRVVRSGQSFRGDSKFRTWLYAIAGRLCIDAARRDSHRIGPSLDAPVGREPDAPTLGDRIAHEGVGTDASRNAADAQFRSAFAAAMAELPDEQREVFNLREVGGLSFEEIAEQTRCNVNTVKSRMRYALKTLREALAEFV